MIDEHVRQASGSVIGPRQPAVQDIFAGINPEQFGMYIRPVARRIVRDMIREIRERVPAYAQPLEGEFGKILVTSVERSVLQVVESLGRTRVDTSAWEDWFRHVGRVEFLAGRSMDAMQSAIRIGTRVAWRHIRATGEAIGAPADTTFAFADALFRYTDELAAVAIRGYAEAQARASGTTERRRQQLLKLLLSEKTAAPQTIVDLARATEWALPDRVSVVALEFRADQYDLPATALGPEVLVDMESDRPCLIVAEPERHLDVLAKELDGRRAAIGPNVPLGDAHQSFAAARRALELARRDILPPSNIIHCEDHLAILALCADEFVLRHLTRRALRPFAALTVKQRDRLSETLLAWLGTRGGINDIAGRLGVHPQTVRYRMNQINNLLGERLDDPDDRLELEIALRASRFVGHKV